MLRVTFVKNLFFTSLSSWGSYSLIMDIVLDCEISNRIKESKKTKYVLP